MSKLLTIVTAAIVAAGSAAAGTITNRFGDPPAGGCAFATPVPVDGVSALGVTFGFTEGGNPSNAAMYGVCIGTDTNLLEPSFKDLLLDGPTAGTLTLNFAQPSTFLSFDVLFVGIGDSGGTVTLNGFPTAFSTTGGQGYSAFFSIGEFSASGAPFTTAVITFDQSAADAFYFAIDNLAYSTPGLRGPQSPVPEPGSLMLLGAGTLLLGIVRARRRA